MEMTRYRHDKGGIYDRFTRSVAPRIYGNEELVLEILVRWTLYRSRVFSRKSSTCFPSTLPFTGSYYITDGPSSCSSAQLWKSALHEAGLAKTETEMKMMFQHKV